MACDKRQSSLIWFILTAIIGLISMILAIVAYSKWKTNADEFFNIINHWERLPITNITIVAANAACPSGYTTLGFGSPNVQTAQCEFEGTTYYATFCETLGFQGNGTDSYSSVSYTLQNWKKSHICGKFSGVNAIERPLEEESGYSQHCGAENPETGPFYWPTGEDCPFTYISRTPPSGAYETLNLGNGDALYVSRDSAIGRPYIDFATGEGRPCQKDFDDFEGVRSVSYKDGQNITGGLVYVQTGLTRNSVRRTEHPQYSACTGDNRFVVIDAYPEDTFFKDNRVATDGVIPDAAYIFADDSLTANHTMWNRPEILWKKDCTYTRKDVDGVKLIIKQVTGATVALMIISIIAALFDCAMEGWNVKNQYDNDDSNDEVAGIYGKYGNIICTVGTLVTTIVTFVFVSKGKSFFRAMKDDNCSDSQTDAAIGYLSSTAIELFDIWAGKLTLDVLKIIYYVYALLKAHGICCADDDKDDEDGAGL